jgi:alcohol dehydrogenase (NADP+)
MIELSDLRMTRIPLSQGAGHMPALGFGTLIPDAAETITATSDALEAGFRHFDCAERYGNEREVGRALQAGLAAGRIAREDIFVTTKLWNSNHRPERVEPAFEASLDRLGLKYLDLYLIHTPFAFQPGDDLDPRDQDGSVLYDHSVTLLDTWNAMENLVDHGKCRAIGLSDISLNELKTIYESARIKPAVIQVESHPYLPETELVGFCKEKGIVFLAFAPLGHGMKPGPLEDPVISAIAVRVGKTPAQVLLAWAVQRGTALLTTPRSAARARENFDISALPEDALDEINRIQTRRRLNEVVKTGVPGFIPQGREPMKAKPHLEQSVQGEEIRKALNAHWQASAAGDANAEHDIYDDAAICDYPQSGERILGRNNMQALRSHHPGKPSGFKVRRILGNGNLWITEYTNTYQGRTEYTVSIMEFRSGKVVHETQYFADPFEAPVWRRQWVQKIG